MSQEQPHDAIPERRIERQSPLRIAVLISGSGTTLKNLLERIKANQLDVEIRCVVSSHQNAKGIQYAIDNDIPSEVLRPKDFASAEEYRDRLFGYCDEHDVSMVVMGGFIKHVLIPERYDFRVLNIHPSLIPAFCGQGFYGSRVHDSVLQYGCKVSGCTVHFVDNEYDHGPIVLQKPVPVRPDDSPQTLAARVFKQECDAYPEALQAIAEGRVSVEGRMIRVAAEPSNP